MYAYYLYTVQSRKLEPNPVRCQDIVELLTIVVPWVCGSLTYPKCTVNKHIVNASQIYTSQIYDILIINK